MGTASHPFGDLLTQHLHRRHGLSQAKLAAGIDQPAQVITLMCQGKRLTGPQARARVVAIIRWLQQEQVLTTQGEAHRLLAVAGMTDLDAGRPDEATLLDALTTSLDGTPAAALNIAAPIRRTNLPIQLSRFIGRERELRELKDLLANRRMVCLTGTGGCGKTRLALQVAGDMRKEFPDGVWLVELAALSNPGLVPQAVAFALGLRDEPGSVPAEMLTAYLHDKQLLLVLDNCEHLVEACAQLAGRLLQTCPALTVLATSRESLRIAGEATWRVPSLSLPDLPGLQAAGTRAVASLMQSEAAQLFCDRAAAIYPSFAVTPRNALTIARICIRLDGIPLALELAAALVHGFSVGEIAELLNDRFRLLTGGSRTALPRHQTLRALIDWSYDLLTDAERVLLARLSVFAGGWTLEAAETVATAPPEVLSGSDRATQRANDAPQDPVSAIPATLFRLVSKSLVVADHRGETVRYRLLDTIREYAREKLLSTGGAEQIWDQHLAYFLCRAEAGAAALQGPQRRSWLEYFRDEHDNLRAALRWAIEGGRTEPGLRLAGALARFWSVSGHLAEGRAWLAGVLALPGGSAQRKPRASALQGAGTLASGQDDLVVARAMWSESLAIWREVGDLHGVAVTLTNLSRVSYRQGKQAAASALLEESLAIWSDLADRRGIAEARNIQGEWARAEGQYQQARVFYEESLARYEQLGDVANVARELHNLGQVALAQNNAPEAAACFRRGLTLVGELGNQRGIAACLIGLGAVAQREGQPERAVQLFGAAQSLLDTIAAGLEAIDQKEYERHKATALLALDPTDHTDWWSRGRAMMQEQAIALALSG